METQAYFDNIRDHIQVRLAAAEHRIDLAVAWFTDRILFEQLCQKAKSGVKVRLLLFDDDINKYLNINDLERAGGKVFRIAEKLMHNKFCVIDRAVVISGSYNWTNKAHNDNYENIAVTTGDAFFAEQFIQEFNRIVERHFGEKQEHSLDFTQIVKRLELIKHLIELGDTDDLPPQYRKLKTLHLPNDIHQILDLLQAQRYGEAVAQITDFSHRFQQVTRFVDTEISALKLEMHALELDISSLDTEKADAEKTIQDFEIQYNRHLGQLLLDILALRRRIAQKQAQAQPDNADAQDRQAETDADFNNYHANYEATKAKPLSHLTADEQATLKERYRAAVKLCHPDMVADAAQLKAQALFVELQEAYEANNLARVTAIRDALRDGKPFDAAHTAIHEKQQLRQAINRLRQRRAQLIAELQQLKQHNTYQLIQNTPDWQHYFTQQKVALDERRIKLQEEWKRINI